MRLGACESRRFRGGITDENMVDGMHSIRKGLTAKLLQALKAVWSQESELNRRPFDYEDLCWFCNFGKTRDEQGASQALFTPANRPAGMLPKNILEGCGAITEMRVEVLGSVYVSGG